jgi:hypothetical protein
VKFTIAALGGRIRQQGRARVVRLDRRGVDDDAAALHARQGGTAEPERRVHVRPEGAIEFLRGEVFDAIVRHLECGVVDEDVQAPEIGERALDEGRAVLFVLDIAGNRDDTPARLPNPARSLLRIAVFRREIADEHIRAFARVRNRDGASDPAVAAGDEGNAPLEAAQTAIRLLAVIGLRPHLPVEPGRRDGGLWIFGFRAFLFRIHRPGSLR